MKREAGRFIFSAPHKFFRILVGDFPRSAQRAEHVRSCSSFGNPYVIYRRHVARSATGPLKGELDHSNLYPREPIWDEYTSKSSHIRIRDPTFIGKTRDRNFHRKLKQYKNMNFDSIGESNKYY